MLWYTDNTFVKEDKDGNKRFWKGTVETKRPDGFHAFITALYKREIIKESTVETFLMWSKIGNFRKDNKMNKRMKKKQQLENKRFKDWNVSLL